MAALVARKVPELAIQYAPRNVRAIRLAPRRFRRIGLLTPKDGLRTAAMDAWISLVQDHFHDGVTASGMGTVAAVGRSRRRA